MDNLNIAKTIQQEHNKLRIDLVTDKNHRTKFYSNGQLVRTRRELKLLLGSPIEWEVVRNSPIDKRGGAESEDAWNLFLDDIMGE